MTVLAIGGYAESGKDAFADTFELALDYKRTFMSKPLARALLTLDPLIKLEVFEIRSAVFKQLGVTSSDGLVRYSVLHDVVGYADSKKEPEVRRLLQMLGTEVGRTMFGIDCWIDRIVSELDTDVHSSWVITGVRYQNELDKLRWTKDATSVWIHRPGVEPINSHSSDNSLGPEDFHYQINNDGTLLELAQMARKFHSTLQ